MSDYISLREFIYPRHLNSVLSDLQLVYYRNHPNVAKLRAPNIPHESYHDIKSGFLRGVAIFPWIERNFLESELHHGVVAGDILSIALDVAYLSCFRQAQALYKNVPGFTHGSLSEMREAIKTDPLVRKSIREKHAVETLHGELSVRSAMRQQDFRLPGWPGVLWARDIVCFENFPRGPLSVTYDMVLCVLDRIEARFTFACLLACSEKSPAFSHLNMKSIQWEWYMLLEKGYKVLGCKMHKLLKSLEPICVGFCLANCEPEWNQTGFFQDTIDDLNKSLPEGRVVLQSLIDCLEKLSVYPLESRVHIALELFGQEKLHYFPIVDEEAGNVKMNAHGTAYQTIQFDVVDKVLGASKRMFIEAYYLENHKLPPVKWSMDYHPIIREMYTKKILLSKSKLLAIPDEAWTNVVFAKVFQYDYQYDPMDVLVDKACTPDAANWSQVYGRDVRKESGIPNPRNVDPNRFVEWLMRIRELDIFSLTEKFIENQGLAPHQRLTRLKGKERENKIESRSFSILHPEVRCIVSTMEYNIKNSLYPYYPQQTMTSTGAQLLQTVDRLSAPVEKDGEKWVAFHLDFEQWNYKFRERMTVGFSDMLDQLFGTKHYHYMMRAFSDAVFMSANVWDVPTEPGRFTWWDNHIGGNQGIAQKFWTWITINLIRTVMERQPYKYHLIGSGDNQVLFVCIPPTDNPTTVIPNIKDRIRAVSNSMGLTLKADETWHSNCLVAYQRKYYFAGAMVSQIVKTACRFASGISDGENTLGTHTGTCMSAGQQMISAAPDPSMGPFLAYFNWVIGLLLNPRWSPYVPRSVEKLVATTMFGSDLGFFPLLQLPGMLYAGHKSPVAENLSLSALLLKEFPSETRYIKALLRMQKAELGDNYATNLLIDPGSPNLRKPMSGDAVLKNAVEKYLCRSAKVRNLILREALSQLIPERVEELSRVLIRLTPLNLSVIHILLSVSKTGQAISTVNRFTRLSTIVKMYGSMLARDNNENLMTQVRNQDIATLRAWSNKLSCSPSHATSLDEIVFGSAVHEYRLWTKSMNLEPNCTTHIHKWSIIWSYELKVSDIAGPFTPAPSEQLIWHKYLKANLEDHSILVTPAGKSVKTTSEKMRKRGPFSMMFGSATKEPMPGLQLSKCVGGDAGTALTRLYRLFCWIASCGGDENLQNYILAEMESRMPGVPEIVKARVGTPSGGHIEHRLTVPGDQMGARQMSRSMLSTWYVLSTNKAKQFQRGEEDYNVFFQQLFQHIVAGLHYSTGLEQPIAVEIRLDHCTQLLMPSEFHLDCAVPEPPASLASLDHLNAERRLGLLTLLKEANPTIKGEQEIPVSREVGLIAHQSMIYINHLRNYTRGGATRPCPSTLIGAPSALLNITLLREVSLSSFLRTIAMLMAFHHQLDNSHSRRTFLARLNYIKSTPTGVFDTAATHPLLSALLAAGKYHELVVLAGGGVSWIRSKLDHSMNAVFIRALRNVVDNWNEQREEVVFPVEGLLSQLSSARIHSFFMSWSPTYRFKHRKEPIGDPASFLLQCGKIIGNIRILEVTNRHELLSEARSMEPLESTILQLDDRPSVQSIYRNISWDSSTPQSLLMRSDGSINTQPERDLITMLGDLGNAFSEIPHDANQMARYTSGASGARVKLLEVLNTIGGAPHTIDGIVCLADGSGSFLSTLCHLYPNVNYIYNGLMDPEELSHGQLHQFIPPDLCCECDIVPLGINLPYSPSCNGDLRFDSTWSEIFEQLPKLKSFNTILTFDMGERATGRLEVLPKVCNALSIIRPHTAIIKVFLHELSLLEDILQSDAALEYYSWTLIRCHLSNHTATELYLVFERSTCRKISVPLTKNLPRFQLALKIQSLDSGERWLKKTLAWCVWLRTIPPCQAINPASGEPLDTNSQSAVWTEEALMDHLTQAWRFESDTTHGVPRAIQHMLHSVSQANEQYADFVKVLWLASLTLLGSTPLFYAMKQPLPCVTFAVSLWKAIRVTINHPEFHALPASSKHLWWRMIGHEVVSRDTGSIKSRVTCLVWATNVLRGLPRSWFPKLRATMQTFHLPATFAFHSNKWAQEENAMPCQILYIKALSNVIHYISSRHYEGPSFLEVHPEWCTRLVLMMYPELRNESNNVWGLRIHPIGFSVMPNPPTTTLVYDIIAAYTFNGYNGTKTEEGRNLVHAIQVGQMYVGAIITLKKKKKHT